MSDFVRSLATEQRNRLVGTVLGYLEKEVYPSLPAQKRREVREKVLAATGVYHDFVLDCLRATAGSDGIANEEAIRLLQSIQANQTVLRASLDRIANG